MKFELKKPYQHYTDTELIEDLQRVASVTGRSTVTQDDYEAARSLQHVMYCRTVRIVG